MSQFKQIGKNILPALAVLLTAIALAFVPGWLCARADEEFKDYVHPEEYENGYYEGEITKDGSGVRKTPGTKNEDGSKKNDVLQTSAGKDVILAKGTKVTIWGESRDSDMDIWYHVKVTYSGEEFEGYVFTGRAKRLATQITFSPTPTPEPTATNTPTPTVEQKGELSLDPSPTASEVNEKIVKDSKNPKIYKFIIILVCIIIVGAVAYWVVMRISERKIDEVMNKNSRRDFDVERLEEESDEDYREAKKSALKGRLQDQTDRDIAEEIGVEDFKLDLEGVFDDEDTTQGSVSEAVTEAVTEEEASHAAGDAMLTDAAEAAATVDSATDEWSTQNQELLRHLSENADEQEKALIAQIVPNYGQEGEAEEISEEELTARIRAALDELKEQDTLVHTEYGVGEVIDNSDPQIIQVRFGRDLRFLKKDKLARRKLVDL